MGTESEWQLDYSDRVGLDKRAGDTKIDHLRRTLSALAETLSDENRVLDAIIVSGDLTNGNNEDGYRDFEPLLDELGDRRPVPEHILVVPGNHDADWTLRPGNPEKFKRFLDAVRPSFRSPLIRGLDYDDNELDRRTGSRKKAQPILELSDTAIVAISSADFSGVEERTTETPWGEVIASFRAGETSAEANEAREVARKDLRALRVHDMPRVDKRQLEGLSERMNKTSLAAEAELDVRLRIAVLHHPIGPVTSREEIKPFEALTNLEQVRGFLFDRGFHVVLHGHKHASYLGWDWLLPAGEDLSAIPKRALVIGSPGDFRPRQLVCRLLESCPDGDSPVAGAPRLRIVDVRGVRTSQRLNVDFQAKCLSLAQPYVHSMDTGTPWVVRARTANAAYQQLRDLPTDANVPRPVISVVEDPLSADELPQNYPEPKDDAWLESLATWWQLRDPEAVHAVAGSDFNHGERLYGGEDAIANAARALPSSKAIALLVNSDEAGHPEREFPALTAVQLHARRDTLGTLLDTVGIYRKQDLQLWWPVNMAELAYIQRKAVVAAADNSELKSPILRGKLIAVATIGLHDTVLPQMAGTVLDRSLDLRPQWPNRLAYLAAKPRRETQSEWREALSDVGTQDEDVVLVPSIGLKRLKEALAMHRDIGGGVGKRLTPLIRAVEKLDADAAVAVEGLEANRRVATRAYWSSQLREDADQVLSALKALVQRSTTTWR